MDRVVPALAIGPSTVALPIVVVDDLAGAAIVCSASFGFAGSATGATFGFFSGGCQINAQDNGSHVSTCTALHSDMRSFNMMLSPQQGLDYVSEKSTNPSTHLVALLKESDPIFIVCIVYIARPHKVKLVTLALLTAKNSLFKALAIFRHPASHKPPSIDPLSPSKNY